MERVHNLEAGAVSSPIEELAMDQNDTGVGSGVEPAASDHTLLEKMSLMTKLKELEDAKAKADAKFDGDIEALKRVLSFM